MVTTVSSKGQIVLPAVFREQDEIRSGQRFEIERLDPGEYRLVRKEQAPNEGVVAALLSCSVEDWHQPLDLGSTDDIGKGLFDEEV